MGQPKYRWRVNIIESERGWGQKIDDIKFFDSEEEATAYVTQYNAKNNEPVVPDWYMYADGPTKVMVDA